MSFKKTITFSIVLHLCFFAAAVLLPAGLLGNGNKIPREIVFFVKLTKDTGESGSEQSKVKIKKSKTEKTRNIKIETEEVITVDPMRKEEFLSHRVNTDAVSEKNDFSMEREPEGKVLLTNYTGSERVVDISFTGEAGNQGTSKNNKRIGVLSAEIFEIIRNSIEKTKTYPMLARKRGIEGTVYIRFSISPEGKPQDLRILKGSGSSILDNATLDIVKKAAPLPYVDAPIEVPVVFRLN